MIVTVKDVVQSSIAVSADKGEILHSYLEDKLKSNEKVVVDFDGITDLTTAFLNVGIGHLYNKFTGQELNQRLEIVNLDELDSYLMAQVIERVKLNQDNESKFSALVREVLDEDGYRS